MNIAERADRYPVRIEATFRGGPFNGQRLLLECDSREIRIPVQSGGVTAIYVGPDDPLPPVYFDEVIYVRDWLEITKDEPTIIHGLRRGRASYSLKGL